MQKKDACPKCGNNQRDSDFSKPCELCGSKTFVLIGYRYPKEAKDIYTMIGILATVLFLAILAGAVFLIFTQFALMP